MPSILDRLDEIDAKRKIAPGRLFETLNAIDKRKQAEKAQGDGLTLGEMADAAGQGIVDAYSPVARSFAGPMAQEQASQREIDIEAAQSQRPALATGIEIAAPLVAGAVTTPFTPLAQAAAVTTTGALARTVGRAIRGEGDAQNVAGWVEPLVYGGAQAAGMMVPGAGNVIPGFYSTMGGLRAAQQAARNPVTALSTATTQPVDAMARATQQAAAFAARNPVTAQAIETAAPVVAAGTIGAAADSGYRAATGQPVTWEDAGLGFALGGFMGLVPGVLRGRDVAQLAAADRAGLMQMAQKYGFNGTWDELAQTVREYQQGRDILNRGRQQNMRRAGPAEEGAATPEGQIQALPENYATPSTNYETGPGPVRPGPVQGQGSGSGIVPVQGVGAQAGQGQAAPAGQEAVAAPTEGPMPQWVRDEMVARGLDPNRPLNDADLANQSVRDGIQSDPTLTPEQKQNVLETGSAEAPAPTTTETNTPSAEAPEPVVPKYDESRAFYGRPYGRTVDFPSRQDAEEYLSEHKSRPGFNEYEAEIVPANNGKTFDIKYRKLTMSHGVKIAGKPVDMAPEAVAQRIAFHSEMVDTGPTTKATRWDAIQNSYRTAKAAQAALPRVPFKDIFQVQVREKNPDPTKNTGPGPIVDTFFVPRDEFPKFHQDLDKLYPGKYSIHANANPKPYSPKKGEPTYQEWLKGKTYEDPEVGAEQRIAKMKAIEAATPRPESLPANASWPPTGGGIYNKGWHVQTVRSYHDPNALQDTAAEVERRRQENPNVHWVQYGTTVWGFDPKEIPMPEPLSAEQIATARESLARYKTALQTGVNEQGKGLSVPAKHNLKKKTAELEKRLADAGAAPATESGDAPFGPMSKEAQQAYNDAFDEVMQNHFQDVRDSVTQDPKQRVSAEAVAKEKGEVLTPAAAKARIQKWKDLAAKQGETGKNSDKIILSLFDSTGVWSQPWRDAGYTVIQIDKNIVNDGSGFEIDVMKIDQQWLVDNGLDMVHGVLAACPCTEFAGSGARWFKEKDLNGKTEAAKNLVNQTLAIIEYLQPDMFWAIENPVGRLKALTDIPLEQLQFQPHNYGDPYTKRTQIYGMFNPNLPQANVEPTGGSYAWNLRGDDTNSKAERSTTFEGFAYAFFAANHNRNIEADAEEIANQAAKDVMAKQAKKPAPAPAPAPQPASAPVPTAEQKAFNATAAGQKQMAAQAASDSVILMLNDKVRQLGDTTWSRSVLEKIIASAEPMARQRIYDDLVAVYNDLVSKKPAPAPAPAEPTQQDLVKKWLTVEEPDSATAIAAAKVADDKVKILTEQLNEARAGLKQIEPKVIRQTGPSYKRGQMKDSAPAALKKQYMEIKKRMGELEVQINETLYGARQYRREATLASVRRIVNDPNQPLINRLAKRLYLYNETTDKVGPEHEELAKLFNEAAAAEVLKRFPDATPEEIKTVSGNIERYADNLDRAFQMAGELSVYNLRRAELSKELTELKYREWRGKSEAEVLNKEIDRYTREFRPAYEARNQVQPESMTRLQLAGLVAEAKLVQKRIGEAEEAAKSIEQKLYEGTKAVGVKQIGPDGIEVSPTKGFVGKVSKLSTSKMLTAQREFMVKVLTEAAAKAPGPHTIMPEFKADYEVLLKLQKAWETGKDANKTQADIVRLAQKYLGQGAAAAVGKIGEGKVVQQLLKGIESRLPEGTPAELLIHVPDDGTVRVANWKPTLEAVAKRVGAVYGKNLNYVGPKAGATRPAPLARVADNPSAGEITKVLGEFRKDEGPLSHIMQWGDWAVSSNGHVMIWARGGKGLAPAEIQAKAGQPFPEIGSIMAGVGQGLKVTESGVKLGPGEARPVNTEELAKQLSGAIASLNADGKKEFVQVHFTKDGSVGISYAGNEAEYRGANVTAGEDSVGVVNPYTLRDTVEAMRRLGVEKIEIQAPKYAGDDKSAAFVIKGGDKAAAMVTTMKKGLNEKAPFMGDSERAPAEPPPAKPAKEQPKTGSGTNRGAVASTMIGTAPPEAPPPPSAPPYQNREFTRLPFQLPEMVKLYRLISGGRNPKIAERIRTMHGEALGVFRYVEGNLDSGRIELRADLFHLLSQEQKQQLLRDAFVWARLQKEADPNFDFEAGVKTRFEQLVRAAEEEAMTKDPIRALRVFAHEIGHYVDFFPDAIIRARGNIFGHMAALKRYMKDHIPIAPGLNTTPPTKEERSKLRRQAEKELNDLAKTVTETITREIPVYKEIGLTPDHITGIVKNLARDEFPEFYDWFARQDRATKAEILKKAMKGLVDERLAKFGKRIQTGTETVTETITHTTDPVTPEQIRKRYEELLAEELKKRGLISQKQVVKELEGVIAWYHGRETMPDYFRTPWEMFAEAFSILMNNPTALKTQAPTWWQAFNNYLAERPKVGDLYQQLQDLISAGDLMKTRVEDLRESWHQSEENLFERELGTELTVAKALRYELGRVMGRGGVEPLKWRELKDNLNSMVLKTQGPIQRKLRKKLMSPEGSKLAEALKRYLYRQTAIEGFARQITERVESILAANNFTHTDMGEFMFVNRILKGDAIDKLNSQGWSPNIAGTRLQEMQQMWGPQRIFALTQAAAEMRAIYEEYVVKPLREANVLPPETMAKIEENIHYAPFQRGVEAFNAFDEETIIGLLNRQVGSGVSARIYRRIGSSQDIRNPYTALVAKAESLIRFVHRQNAFKAYRDFKLEFDRDTIAQAPAVMRDGRRVPLEPRDENVVGMFITLDGGVPTGWYVPKHELQAIESIPATEWKIVSMAMKPLGVAKALLTELNPGFWPRAFYKDIKSYALTNLGGTRSVIRELTDWQSSGGPFNLPAPRSYAAARASLAGGTNKLADQILRREMVISRADPRGNHLGHPDELNRWLLRMSKHPQVWDQETKKIDLLLRAWETWKRQGQILERTVKVMAMRNLDRMYGGEAPDPNIQWVAMPEWIKQRLVVEFGGSPDFLEKGRFTPVIEATGGPMFIGPWVRGKEQYWRAAGDNDMRLPGQQSRGRYWSKYMTYWGLPVIAYTLYQYGFNPPGSDPKKNAKEREMLRSIPERDFLAGYVIPLGYVDKIEKKVAYILLPYPDEVRLQNAVLRKLAQSTVGSGLTRDAGLSSLLAYQGQDIPGQNPFVTAVYDWFTYTVLGRNPYDPFRSREKIDKDRMQAKQGAGQLAQDSLSNISGGMIPRPPYDEPGVKPTALEEFLRLPVASSILGRWVRVSNQGLREDQRAILEPVEQTQAELRLVGRDLIQRMTREGDKFRPTQAEYTLVTSNPYLLNFMGEYYANMVKGMSGPEARAFMKADNEGRIQLLKVWTERAAPQK